VFVHKVVHSRSSAPKALTSATKEPFSASLGDPGSGRPHEFADVLLDLPVPHALQYRLTPEQQSLARVGMRCVVPVGPGRLMLGIVAALSSECSLEERRVRTLTTLLADPNLSQDWLQLCQFAADYYHHPWAQVALGALPPSLRRVPGPRAAAGLARLRRAPPAEAAAVEVAPPRLRDEQREAIGAIAQARGFAPFLLHGVTGSGKTEVYLGALAAALESDPLAQALWLVPEINLTPQFEARLRRRFEHLPVVSLHSGLAPSERTSAWLAAHEGRARIVLGTRLAAFASLPHLRIVIVDEEHDTSFKASDGVRYSARDLAVKRAQLGGIPVVLGSATPSLESWQQALSGRYTLLRLLQRGSSEAAQACSGTLSGPRVQTVDLRQHPAQQGLSAPLRAALGEALERGEQALVFINRRGYAPVLACDACGWLSGCPNCSAHAAFHRADGAAGASLRCHHCGWSCPVPRACPTCGNQDLKPVGQATQRLEETLRQTWPAARIGRLDRDSARRPDSAQQTLQQVHEGELDVLVGTQMIAKGHDFRRVSVVCVLNADAQLVAADFRAPERLFALLMQVAGRAGRAGQAARVLVQTRFPDHPLYEALALGDYGEFAREQLVDRRAARMPPFTCQALLAATAPALPDALQFLADCRRAGRDLGAGQSVALYDPVPMPLARLASEMRAQLLVEASRRAPLHQFLNAWLDRVRSIKTPRRLRWHIDVDPMAI
jgi:primosomal protein N' (replication factor Y) (superfamily II helicase)